MNYPHIPTAVLRNIVANYERGGYRPDSPFWVKEAEIRAELAMRELSATETQESEAVKKTEEFPAYRETE